MFYVSEIHTDAPKSFGTPLQEKTYGALAELGIAFERVETDEAITMEDCVAIDAALDMKMVKTLFLCDRKKEHFYICVTTGGKHFSSKSFAHSAGVARVSFAPPELMSKMLGTKIGAATVFSALLESARDVRIYIDKDVLEEEFYGCSDGTTTGYMKIRTSDITEKFLPHAGHAPVVIELQE